MPNQVHRSLLRLWVLDTFSQGLRVLLAMSGVLLLCLWQGWMPWLIPLYLGVFAGALAESDDSWQGRLHAVLVTLLCFGCTAYAVEWLLPHPWPFVALIVAGTFGLTLLGALGERYATIGAATLILAVYCMISVTQRGIPSGNEPLLLVAGAAWYGLLSVLWSAGFVLQPVHQSLARVFRELGDYLYLKGDLFEPVRGLDLSQRQLALARQNSRLVDALNNCREIMLHRVRRSRIRSRTNRYLKLYFLAQDVHERASSSHYPYNELADTFFHSDVLFRCQRLLRLNGQACQALADAIELRQPFVYPREIGPAQDDLQDSLQYLEVQRDPRWHELLRSVHALSANIGTLNQLLSSASNPDTLEDHRDSTLLDLEPHSLRDVWERISGQLTIHSVLFRHGIRLALALAAGYGLLHVIPTTQGYWILLTTLFVCRPSYGATRLRLIQRVAGTIVGLVLGWAALQLFPAPSVQILLTIVTGVLFYILRATRYSWATAAITMMVLLSFNLVGDGFDLIWPRLIDTLIGCALSVAALFLILPDWQGRQLNKVLATTLRSNSRYLQQIMQQYGQGKVDDLAYRIARRDAHNATSALSTSLSNMLKEPQHFRRDSEMGFRFLLLSHTLLSYLSALGAHRTETLPADALSELAIQAQSLCDQFNRIATALESKTTLDIDTTERLTERLTQNGGGDNDAEHLIRRQLALIHRELPPLVQLANQLASGSAASAATSTA